MEEEIKVKKTRKKKDEAVVVQCPNQIRLRDENGLIPTVNYIKDANGFIVWRDMISDEHIVLNKMRYAADGIDLQTLPEDELAKIKADAPESRKLIKLGGFKEILKLRGVIGQRFDLVHRAPDFASVSCTINFISNFENPYGLEVTAIAQASLENVNGEYAKYLDVIASNRSFVRCVKEALGILTLSEEEILIEDVKIAQAKPGSPLHLLQKTCLTYNLKIEDLKQIFREQVENNSEESGWLDSWVSFDTLPTSVIATLIPKIKKTYKNNGNENKTDGNI